MAAGFQLGYDTVAARRAQEREDRLRAEDAARQLKVADLWQQRQAIRSRLGSLGLLDGSDPKVAANPTYQQSVAALDNITAQLDDLHDPVKNPGALQRDWDLIKSLILRRPQPPAAAPPATSTATTTRTSPMPASRMPPATANTASLTRAQRQQQAQQQRIQQEVGDFLLGGPLTPEQQAEQQSAVNMAVVNQAMKDYHTLKPDATPEQKTAFFNDLIAKQYGFTQQRPVWKEYTSADGARQWFDASRPDLIPPGWTAAGAAGQSADTRARADFETYKKQHPEYTGSFEQWKTEQSQLGRLTVPTSRDDRYIAIQQKKALGQPVSREEQAYSDAYDLYVQKRIIDPVQARAAAFAADRFVPVMDPADPQKVIFMRAADAARAGAGTPASIAFQTDKSVTRLFTSGQAATNLNYFNTAIDHLRILQQAADALNNGDVQLFNRWANNFAAATGNPAPVDFDTVKSAVAGEIAKTFKGATGATDAEIGEINAVINRAQSPDQIRGAISYYTQLMDGKVSALRAQYEAGLGGRPAFPSAATPRGGAQPQPGLTRRFLDGGKIYTIPAALVPAFRRDHPRAREVR